MYVHSAVYVAMSCVTYVAMLYVTSIYFDVHQYRQRSKLNFLIVFFLPNYYHVGPYAKVRTLSLKPYYNDVSAPQNEFLSLNPEKPSLQITNEPQDARFRYRTERETGTHGSLRGVTPDHDGGRSYPTVEVNKLGVILLIQFIFSLGFRAHLCLCTGQKPIVLIFIWKLITVKLIATKINQRFYK